ncbi:TolC family protein [Aureibacter tunicatorum]|uniref:Outer membrane protein TolC n=1 Tax=Aureibacter tunicatorum TaxID=866807 RepID=A0AAE3XM23_9BACT|nr:TolC family protein [Aureibacter tunicatorum]MDR6238276.1 outer membrane protein TolC [Aureibacter tunicatorum]BDD03309.1 transporter [Aureibacter tunicatorum]
MHKSAMILLCAILLHVDLLAQTHSMTDILQSIERNNYALKALRTSIEQQNLENQASNNLPDPELDFYYLPIKPEEAPYNYSELEFRQSFEFPTVYAMRKKWIDKEAMVLESQYAKKKQEVLLPAQQLLVEISSLNKKKFIEAKRLEQSQTILSHLTTQFEKGAIGVLELNKAKIAWMQDQFAIDQIDLKIRKASMELTKMNSGLAIAADQFMLEDDFEMDSYDQIWKEKQSLDPELTILQQEEAASLQNLKVARHKLLPNLTLGYNSQGVRDDVYSGVFAGISIPLWSTRNKVKIAKSNVNLQALNAKAELMKAEIKLKEQFETYALLKKKHAEYEKTLGSLNSEQLLYQAFEQGEYSFAEYFVELQFYREAINQKLDLEQELNELKASILIYKL